MIATLKLSLLLYLKSEEIQQKSERENSKLQKMIFLSHGSGFPLFAK